MPYTYACEGERETLHLSIGIGAGDDGERPAALRPLFAAADPLIVSIGTALLNEATADARDRLYGETMATALRAHLVRHYGAAPPAGSSAARTSAMPRRQMQRVLEFIESHLGYSLGLGELAKVAGMSRTRFLSGFKRATGESPHRYLIQRRVERAKILLADPDLSLHEVAARLGYAEQASFSRVFRRIAQITPGAYRALYHR
jgi:AraC family transcriptional regulator